METAAREIAARETAAGEIAAREIAARERVPPRGIRPACSRTHSRRKPDITLKSLRRQPYNLPYTIF